MLSFSALHAVRPDDGKTLHHVYRCRFTSQLKREAACYDSIGDNRTSRIDKHDITSRRDFTDAGIASNNTSPTANLCRPQAGGFAATSASIDAEAPICDCHFDIIRLRCVDDGRHQPISKTGYRRKLAATVFQDGAASRRRRDEPSRICRLRRQR